MVQHNLSFLNAEHLFPYYDKIFPDSNMAKNFQTTSILNEVLPPVLKFSLVEYLADEALSLIYTAASDTGVKKVNALCTIFGVKNKRIKFRFYEICATRSENCSKSEIPF